MDIIATIRSGFEAETDSNYYLNVIKRLYQEDIINYRFNLSKWNTKQLYYLIKEIPNIRREHPKVSIILDIPYPKKKTRIFIKNKIAMSIVKNQRIRVKNIDAHHLDEGDFYVECLDVLRGIEEGTFLYFGDGIAMLRLEHSGEEYVDLIAMDKFSLISGKALTFRGSLLKNDKWFQENLHSVLEIQPNCIALSFVESPSELLKVKEILKDDNIKLMAKIESEKGVKYINDIVDVSDALMVARGDLGLHLPLEKMAVAQEHIIEAGIRMNKPVYVATDVLRSYASKKLPSRSDVLDLYHICKSHATGVVINSKLVNCSNYKLGIDLIHKIGGDYE